MQLGQFRKLPFHHGDLERGGVIWMFGYLVLRRVHVQWYKATLTFGQRREANRTPKRIVGEGTISSMVGQQRSLQS